MALKQCLFQRNYCDKGEWYQRYGKGTTDQERGNGFRVWGWTTAAVQEGQECVHEEDGAAKHGLYRAKVEAVVEG